MLKRRLRTIALAGALTLAGAIPLLPAAATVQPSYDTIRITNGGEATLYEVSIDWSPLVINLPDGGAWGFFTAQLRLPTEPGANPLLSNRKLFATRFDPGTGNWQPAFALPGEVAFGPTGVVDGAGTTHLVYTIRGSLDPTSFSTLVYMTVDDAGNWSQPSVIVSSETAGHQLSPDLTIDSDGGLHLAWQDQRGVSDELRAADPSNADVFVSDLNPDGTWSEPVQVNQRPDDATNASRPQLVADGDRLIAVWSVYNTEVGLNTATTLMWSERPIGDSAAWSEPQAIFDRGSDLIGGRFLDMADDPSGGVTLVYGRRTEEANQLYLQRLDQDSDSWSEAAMIASGDRGSYPRIAVSTDGTTYVVYNLGSGVSVKVGALAIAAGQTVAGAEESLTAGEEGIQGIATVSVDTLGRPWVMYFHQPLQQPVEEARVLRSAQISSAPAEEVAGEATPVAETEPAPEASPES
ncbi:MAG: sialidase family protein [Thermomicrobiales bacterium]